MYSEHMLFIELVKYNHITYYDMVIFGYIAMWLYYDVFSYALIVFLIILTLAPAGGG